MVRRLLPLIPGVMLTWGCLLSNPPDYDDAGVHTPVITLREPYPEIVSIDAALADTSTTFLAEFRDDDLGDVVRVRWYLNYSAEAVACSCQVGMRASPGEGVGEYSAVYGLANSSVTAGKCSRLTIVVADGEWADGLENGSCGCPLVDEGTNRVAESWLLQGIDDEHPRGTVSSAECEAAGSENPLAEPAQELSP